MGLSLFSAPAFAQTIAITGGTVAIGDGSDPIEGGTVIISNGRIVSAGRGIAIPSGAQRVDAAGKWVTPGIVAGFSHMAVAEAGVEGANDISAPNSPFSAAIDIAPAINPRSTLIPSNRAGGVTRAVVAPSAAKSIFAGQGAVIDLGGDLNAVTRARAFQYVEFGETGANRAGGSRAAAFVLFRNALREARDVGRYSGISGGQGGRQPSSANDPREVPPEEGPDSNLLGANVNRPDDVLLTRFDAAALVPVLTGRQLLLVHVESATDILQVLGLKREFPRLRLVLWGAAEGWMVAREIAAAGVPVIAHALQNLPTDFELLGATQSNVGRMSRAGVKVGIGMPGGMGTYQARLSTQLAGNLVALGKVPGATGLSWGEALAAITSRPAEAIGMGAEIGSLRAGRRADVVIWDGDPFEVTSLPEMVMIDGVQQPLESRRTKLRDRYIDPTEGALPNAYDKR